MNKVDSTYAVVMILIAIAFIPFLASDIELAFGKSEKALARLRHLYPADQIKSRKIFHAIRGCGALLTIVVMVVQSLIALLK